MDPNAREEGREKKDIKKKTKGKSPTRQKGKGEKTFTVSLLVQTQGTWRGGRVAGGLIEKKSPLEGVETRRSRKVEW